MADTHSPTLEDLYFFLIHSLIDGVIVVSRWIASLAGFPTIPGMPIGPAFTKFYWYDSLKERLEIRVVDFPPPSYARNLFEILIGDCPKVHQTERIFFQSPIDGYFNFYVENYKNIYFMPNWLSEMLQVRLNFCQDIELLEMGREVLFIIIVTYYYMLSFRLLLAWVVNINPYGFPLAYFTSATDWFEEAYGGYFPTVLGVNLATPAFFIIIGKIADSLNHLIFTMPFLPNEGEPMKVLLNGKFTDILVFRHLPALWYEYGVPNDLREHWYTENQDFFKELQKTYEDVNFLPDRLIETNLDLEQVLPNQASEIHSVLHFLPNQASEINSAVQQILVDNLLIDNLFQLQNHYVNFNFETLIKMVF